MKAKLAAPGVPVAELIRAALRDSQGELDAALPRSIGAGSGGAFPAADDEAVLAPEWGARPGGSRDIPAT